MRKYFETASEVAVGSMSQRAFDAAQEIVLGWW
jgi:hypothetical protein